MKYWNKTTLICTLICAILAGCSSGYSNDFECPAIGPGTCNSISKIYEQNNLELFMQELKKNSLEQDEQVSEPRIDYTIITIKR